MKTQQPSFWCVGNIGDVDPFEYGGGFVLVDRTGVYCPELLILDTPAELDKSQYELSTILLEPLTRIKHEDGCHGLSDNKFHPYIPAWFGGFMQLKVLADSCGKTYSNLLDSFLSACPVERALAYRDAACYWGFSNFGDNRRTLTAEKANLLCDTMLAQIKESKTWHQGYGVSYNG